MTSQASASRSSRPDQNRAQSPAAVRIASTRAGTSATARVCSATTAVRLARRAAPSWARCGQRPSTATAVGSDPLKAFHTSGNAHRASDISRRQYRLPSITAAPRRVQARRNANCAGEHGCNGRRANTSPARASTSASITSDLFLPTIAPRSRAACRDPTSANCPPASDTATDSDSHVIDVGSATATAPGYRLSRRVNDARPANVGAARNRVVRSCPAASTARTTHVVVGDHRRVNTDLHPTRRTGPGTCHRRRSTTTVALHEGSSRPKRQARPRRFLDQGPSRAGSLTGRESPRATTPIRPCLGLPGNLPTNPDTRDGSAPTPPMLVGDPVPHRPRAPRRGPSASHQFPQPGLLERPAPGNDPFHRPEVHPKSVTPRTPPEITVGDHHPRPGGPSRDTSPYSLG